MNEHFCDYCVRSFPLEQLCRRNPTTGKMEKTNGWCAACHEELTRRALRPNTSPTCGRGRRVNAKPTGDS